MDHFGSTNIATNSVMDPHHLDADPDADPDSTSP
jgi:hypothetical protein